MSRTNATLLALLALLLALSLSPEADSAAVPSILGTARDPQGDPQGPPRRIFVREADASNFFGGRSRRGVKSREELNAEQTQILAADRRKRAFREGKRNDFESHAEEERDEQDEQTRESSEQWREFHHDGMFNRHSVRD